MKKIASVVSVFIAMTVASTSSAAIPTCISKHYPGATFSENNIKLLAPDIAEDGAVISVGIKQLPNLPTGTHVREISFFNEFRDEPVARFELGNQVHATSIKTRVRLRQSSNLYAVAKLSDGQVLAGKHFIKVTIGGCGGGGNHVNALSQDKKVCAE